MLRVGLLLVAMGIFTIRYYYNIGPIETIMTGGGILLVMVSFGLIRGLKTSKYGFTSLETTSENVDEKLAVESILLAQTFTNQPAPSETTRFGGGSFGGGGGSGEF